jgi:site-specific DNA recombinase
MTPSHAVKSGKRYRYYISNNLIAGANRGRDSVTGDGLRISAQEIEGHVVTAITMFLSDAQRVLAELCPGDTLAPTRASAITRRARSFGEELANGGCTGRYELIRSLIARIRVDDDAVCLDLKQASFF